MSIYCEYCGRGPDKPACKCIGGGNKPLPQQWQSYLQALINHENLKPEVAMAVVTLMMCDVTSEDYQDIVDWLKRKAS